MMRVFALLLFAAPAIAQDDFGAELNRLHQTTDYAAPGSWTYRLVGPSLVETVSGYIEGMTWTNHHHLCDFDTGATAVQREIDMNVVPGQRHAFLYFPLRADLRQTEADELARAEAAFVAIIEGGEAVVPDAEFRALAAQIKAGAFGSVVARNYTESNQILGGSNIYSFEPLFQMRLIARAEHADQVIALVDATRQAACAP